MSVCVVDYAAGNVVSVLKALTYAGADAELTADPERIAAADVVVFPGQGHFGQSMQRLRSSGLDKVLLDSIASGTPFLGVCLGLQLLFEASDEAPDTRGLGVFAGRCVRFPDAVKIPQIGWNDITVTNAGSPLDDLNFDEVGRHFYFVHSFAAVVPPGEPPSFVAATAHHGVDFAAAVSRDNVFAAQFHPEKSGRAGIALLRALLGRAKGAR